MACGGGREGEGILSPESCPFLTQPFQELGLKTIALAQASATFCRRRSRGQREAVNSSRPREESWPGFLTHRLALDFALLFQAACVWTTAI